MKEARGQTGTYTVPPVSRGVYGREKTTCERWRLHSLQRIPMCPLFFWGIREDTGELVQVHEHRIAFDKEQEGSTESRPTGEKA